MATDFNSKYSGEQVEALLDQVASGNAGGGGGGGITVETDPIFSNSPAASITEDDIRGWNNDHTVVEDLNIDVAQLVEDVKDKQDAISDLETIRDGAAKGATAVQPKDVGGIVTEEGFVTADDLAGVASSGNYNDLVDIPTFKTINGESILGEGDIAIAGGSGEVGPQGPKGDKGDKGDTGVGVQSVAQTTTSNADGGSNVVTVTLTNGAKSTFTVKNGSKGSQGIQGEQGPKGDKGDKGDTGANGTNGTNGKDGADGEDGATFTPSVDSAGNLSWTNNKGLTNPPTVNIRGPKGDKGDSGGGGGGSSSEGGKEYIVVEPDLSIAGSEAYIADIVPNTTYIVSEPVSLLSINEFSVSDALSDEYNVIFKADYGGTTLTINSYNSIYWANGVIPTIETAAVYELSIQRVNIGGGNFFNAVLTHFKIIE